MEENGNGNKPKFEGIPVKLGGVEYVIPSLSTKEARRLWPDILAMDGATMETIPEKQQKMLAVIHAAMRRNYPNLSLEDLDDLVDMRNIRVLVNAAVGASGLEPGGAPPAAAEKIAQ